MLLYRTNIYPKKKYILYHDLETINQKPEYTTFSIDPDVFNIDDYIYKNFIMVLK